MKIPNQEQKVLLIMLLRYNFNLTRAAKKLYLHRNSILYQVKKLNRDLDIDCRSFISVYEYLHKLPVAERNEILQHVHQ